MTTFFSLFWSFLKIGAFTFGGGYAMIPLIEKEVIDQKKWLAKDNFLELLALAQTAPGPIALNVAVFVGYKTYGYKGAIAAVAGIILPSFSIILMIAIYFADFRENKYIDAAFKGMAPAVTALIASPLFRLSKGITAWKILIAITVALAVWYFDISPIYFIIAGAVTGIILASFNKGNTASNNAKCANSDKTSEDLNDSPNKDKSKKGGVR